MDIYAPSPAIIQRIEERVRPLVGLREVYSDASLADVTADAVQTPAVAVITAPFVVRDVDLESGDTLIETRWQLVVITRAGNDRGRATRARDEAGIIAVELIRHLSAWSPAAGFGALMLRQVPHPIHAKAKAFTPLLFGASTTIRAAD